jgi:hypothetical protein
MLRPDPQDITGFPADVKIMAYEETNYKIEDRPAQPGRTRFLSLPEVIYLEFTEKK